MKIELNGQSYTHSEQEVANQECINLYPIVDTTQKHRTPLSLISTPGLAELIDLSAMSIRGAIEHNGILYIVADETLYEVTVTYVSITATKTSRGTLSSASGLVKMAINDTQIMITDTSNNGYTYTPSTTTFAVISDADFTGASSLVFLDSFFIYSTPSAGTLFATAQNDGSSVNALDVATAEGAPDNIVALGVKNRELFVLGSNSVEVWSNTSNPTGFPLTRRDGVFITQGCSSGDSLQRVNDELYFLDDRGFVVRTQGYQLEVISTEAINSNIAGYEIISDAIGMQTEEKGHLFYWLHFPSEKVTWVFDLTNELWHKRLYFTQDDEFEQHLCHIAIKHKKLNIACSRNSGKLYHLSDTYYNDDGDPIHRLRRTGYINAEFDSLFINELQIRVRSGYGLQTGQGSDPQIQMRYSNDSGHSWSANLFRSVGKVGEYGKQVRWNRLGSARDWLFEFRYTEPTSFSMYDAALLADRGFMS